MSVNRVTCVLTLSLYLSFVSFFVSSELLMKPGSIGDSSDRVSDLVKRIKRKAKFDWQKDDGSEETEDRIHDMFASSYANDHDGNSGKQPIQNTYGKYNQNYSSHIDRDKRLKSDIKAILWSSGLELTSSAAHPNSDFNFKTSKIFQKNTRNDSSEGDPKTVNAALADIGSYYDFTVNNSPAYRDYDVSDEKKIQSNIFFSSKLSVSEDKLREYTLSENQKYGVGRAKPKYITAQLSKSKIIEYNEDERELNSFQTERHQIKS